MSEGAVCASAPAAELPGEKGVHLWCITLGGPAAEAACFAVLAEEERARVSRFHFDADRRRAVVSRGALRILLGAYLGRDPGSVRFRIGGRGKPELEAAPGDAALSFNVSHSGDLVLIGVARGRRIGVDVERIRESVDAERIAQRFFSPEEAAVVTAAPAERRKEVFFAHWTAKEAFLKAIGAGLGGGLGSFSLTPRPGGGWKVLSGAEGGQRGSVEWSVVSLQPADGYAGAVAVEGNEVQLGVFDGRLLIDRIKPDEKGRRQ